MRVIHEYGTRPEFVLIGGLVPDMLCATSPYLHAGTTDIDVQVDLEIHAGSGNTSRLEGALIGAGFTPEGRHAWRWVAKGGRCEPWSSSSYSRTARRRRQEPP